MSELVVNVSNIVSPLCYTVLKLEPYTACPFNCAYCYSRWYSRGPSAGTAPREHVVKLFESTARYIYRKGLKPIPFRLSTLVDPFPPSEELSKVSERILGVAEGFEYPLIINTKSSRIVEADSAKKALERLLDKGLAVVQISLSTLEDSNAKLLEPAAPPPSKRLLVISELGSSGYPVVIRLSPFIPGFSLASEEEVEVAMSAFKDMGVKHVVVEALRVEKEATEWLVEKLGLGGLEFEGYSVREVEGGSPVVRVSRRQRVEAYSLLYKYATRLGVGFSTCKEGLFRFHTTDDCCGAYMLKASYGLRATLWDLYRARLDPLRSVFDGVELNRVCKQFSRLCGELLKHYPGVISKPLRYHEKRLLKVLKERDVLQRVAPDIVSAST